MSTPPSFLAGALSRPLFIAGAAALAALSALAGCSDSGGDGAGGAGGGDTQPKWEPLPLRAEAWSHGDPTALEQALLEEVQRARLDPAGEIDILLKVPGVQTAMKQYGVDDPALRAEFDAYSPVPPLSFDSRLLESARAHSQDMADNGFQDHDSSDGRTFDERILAAGYDFAFASENIFAYAESVPYCHAAFMVDWGNPEPGHRNAILDIDGKKRDVGIAIIDAPASPEVGPLVVTQDFARPASPAEAALRFLVGVVYTDADGDGRYDPGEGEAGLFVVPDKGDYHAVTSASGGFSIPLAADSGPLVVQLQDTATSVLDQREVTFTGDNVKLDFVLSPAD
ncbi:MAG: CAP domain-containing protein [Polyangiaceae bacterium]